MMQDTFKIKSFEELSNWDILYNIDKEIRSNNLNSQSIALGNLINLVKNFIKIEEGEEYRRIIVRRHGKGLKWRNSEPILGKNIKTKKQQLLKKGQLIVSRIGADYGAIAIVTEEFSKAIVSLDYFVFDYMENKINPEYLFLISTSQPFINILNKYSTGTVQTRISLQTFLEIKIPVPSIFEQDNLINKYNKKIQIAEEEEKFISQKIDRIKSRFLFALGLSPNLIVSKNINFSVSNFDMIKDWFIGDSDWIYKELKSTNFKVKKIGTYLDLSSKKFYPEELNINRYIHLSDIDSDKGITRSSIYSNADLKNKKSQIVQKGDLMISTIFTDIPKITIVPSKYHNTIVPDSVIVIKPKSNLYNLEFYNLFFQTPIMIKQFKNASSLTNSFKLKKSQLKNFLIITPDISFQNRLIDELSEIVDFKNLNTLYNRPDEIKQAARKDFENAVLN